MKLIIEIDLSGAVFEGSAAGVEVGRILGLLAPDFDDLGFIERDSIWGPLNDSNGNTCGRIRTED